MEWTVSNEKWDIDIQSSSDEALVGVQRLPTPDETDQDGRDRPPAALISSTIRRPNECICNIGSTAPSRGVRVSGSSDVSG